MKAPRVLIVDDEPETRKYVGANLRARGYEILVAEDGRAALKTLAEQLINLVILDITMPDVDGFTVCEALRRQATMPIMIRIWDGYIFISVVFFASFAGKKRPQKKKSSALIYSRYSNSACWLCWPAAWPTGYALADYTRNDCRRRALNLSSGARDRQGLF